MRPSLIPAEETVTPAVVVRARAFAESDKIVTFLTRDLGKVSGIAKGAKRSKRRFVNVLEPFMHVTVTLRLRPHSDLAFVAACELIDAPRSFTRDLDRFAHASYVLELTDRMVQGREAGQATYELVRDGLALLDRHPPEAGMLRAFELHLLRLTGYEPIFHTCQGCGAALASVTRMYVQPLRGGVRCPTCRGEGRAFVVSRETLERLVDLQRSSFAGDDVSRFTMPTNNAAEVRELVRSFFAGSLTKPLASERLLEGL